SCAWLGRETLKTPTKVMHEPITAIRGTVFRAETNIVTRQYTPLVRRDHPHRTRSRVARNSTKRKLNSARANPADHPKSKFPVSPSLVQVRHGAISANYFGTPSANRIVKTCGAA